MIDDLPLYAQGGRTFFYVLIPGDTKYLGYCGVSENINSLNYYQQNEKEIKTICTVKTEVEKILMRKKIMI